MEEVPSQNEVQLHRPEPFNLRHHVTKEEIKPEKPKRRFSLSLPAILVSLFILIVTLGAIGIIFYNKQTQTKIAATNDFESCVAAGNPVMESYPEQCAANGQTFTRILTEEEQEKLSDPTADWKTYQGNGFSFKYPDGWENLEENRLSKALVTENSPTGDFNPGTADINIVEPITNLPKDKLIQRTYLASVDGSEEISSVNGNNALKISGYSGVAGSVYNVAYAIEKDSNNSLIIAMSTQDEELKESFEEEFNQILATFKFTDQESAVDTSDWKTFNSTLEKGLSFKYPADWKTTVIKEGTYETIKLTTPSGFEFFFYSSLIYIDGGCDNCSVTYLEKVQVPNYKTLNIVEGNGATGNVIYLSDLDLKIGDSRLDWFIESKNDPKMRTYTFIGMFNNPPEVNMTISEFANTPEVQIAREILRSVSY